MFKGSNEFDQFIPEEGLDLPSVETDRFQSAIPKKGIGEVSPEATVEEFNQKNRIQRAKIIFGGKLKGEPDEIILPNANVLADIELKVKSGEIEIKDRSASEITNWLSQENVPEEHNGSPLTYLQDKLEELCPALKSDKTPKEQMAKLQLIAAQYIQDIKILQDDRKTTDELIREKMGISELPQNNNL